MIVGQRGEADDPPRPAPRALRPFLRFTRLPDRALVPTRRVLDDDDEFRRAVRDATSEAAVGRAGWLFLDRPAGWEEELAELAAAAAEAAGEAEEARAVRETSRRLALAEESVRRAEGDLARRLAELAELKEQLAGERRSRRRADSEVGRLRQRVAALEVEVEAGRREAAAGREASDQLHDLRRRLADLENENRRAQERVRSLEATPAGAGAADAGRSPGEPTSDGLPATGAAAEHEALDVATLSESVTAALTAVSSLADALAAAASVLAPLVPHTPAPAPPATESPPHEEPGAAPSARASAPRRRRATEPVELPPGVWDDSVEAADHLMRVPGVLVLVDGYNVTKLARPELALADQRRWLADAAAELAARTGARLELVFDGAGSTSSAPAERAHRAGVQLRYSPDGVEADDVVIALVEDYALVRPVVVASDDRRVGHGSRHKGANVISAAQLLAVLRRPLTSS